MTTTSATTPTGANFVAGEERVGSGETYGAIDPRTGSMTGPQFYEATPRDVLDAAAAAAEAFKVTGEWPADRRSALLEAAADRLDGLGEGLIDVVDAETGLGRERLLGERTRTTGQLRAFAELIREGSYVGAMIDRGDPGAGIPDLRRVQVPTGPVAVFGASNFPLAFSVPGGDTASALAVGCPVVAKAHPSHPGTSEMCARAIIGAVADVDGPAGLFSLIHGTSQEMGAALVTAPEVTAVAFTGSLRAGRALYGLAAARPVPVPVYAEMGSLNPLAITTGALRARKTEIARGLVASFTQGTGQFCTKPGLVLIPNGPELDEFVEAMRSAIQDVTPGVLLNRGIHTAYQADIETMAASTSVSVVAEAGSEGGAGLTAIPRVLMTDAEQLTATPGLTDEHFGPVTILVRCRDLEQMAQAVAVLPGGLSGTIHLQEEEVGADGIENLVRAMRDRAGRVVVNGFPTGVAVTHGQVHGGPYPATTAPGHTSVGMTAVQRFQRPVAYQNVPQALLPAALRDDNPLGIVRWVDGEPTREPLLLSAPGL